MDKGHITFIGMLLLFISIVFGAIVCKVVHESGHALTAFAFGAKIESIHLSFPRKFSFFSIRYSQPDVNWKRGLTDLMGTGSTTLLAYILILIVLMVRCPMWLRIGLTSVSFVCAWDMFLYATLPLLGLKRFVFFGGDHAEPVCGAGMMGIPRWLFLCGLTVSFIMFHTLFYWVLRRRV